MAGLRMIRNYLTWQLGHPTHLFLHIPKNAGVSLRKHPQLQGRILPADPYLLKDRAYRKELLATMNANGEHHGYQHARWRDLSHKAQARLQAFAVVRNPWARTVSRWTFGKLAMEKSTRSNDYTAQSFDAFLEERHVWGNKPFYWHRAIRGWYPQLDYVTNEAGEIQADILRLEHLRDELPAYFKVDPAPQRNRSAKADYRSFYTPRTIQIVADWYHADIERFGFDFDTPAQRNYWAQERA
ncbi:sulfotransferase family 2 domain-containing protein [uncultured Thioclava sp.]|uniref:Sulfotransferase family 2 domain-containing protein n=1 Tax=Thioclava arctica TaxID=3238301 RepID=A0ABV3TK94_9RHOB|nr:sulfotransferase family 2 domain-containing protein [uncultured Thioclava sp.]